MILIIMPKLSNKPFEPSVSSGLNIESLISAPLIAASKANVMMLTGQTRFLLEYCFLKKVDASKPEHEIYEPKMINMVLKKHVIDHTKKQDEPGFITEVQMSFSLPLLSIVPLNSLAVDKVNVDFDMEITSITSHENQSNGKIIDKKAQLNGKICNKRKCDNSGTNQPEDQTASRLMVKISASPLPLPVGVLTILDLYSKSILPIPESKTLIPANQDSEKPADQSEENK
jgi:hypothetical protein